MLEIARRVSSNSLVKSWQQLLAEGFSHPHQLLDYLHIPHDVVRLSHVAHQQFKTKVPMAFAAKMQAGNPHDPLLLQVLPITAEENVAQNYSADPLGEHAVNPVKGLLHKYAGRVLLIVSSGCAINCRYCFRRHFPYQQNSPGTAGWQAALDYIQQHPDIHEVILSGGEPLLQSDTFLQQLISAIQQNLHVKLLRIHTRMPIVLPQRITAPLIAALTQHRLQCVLVTHCNHPQELDAETQHAMQQLRHAGITLLNQSVLLQGVNADSKILIELSYRLFEQGIIPYYLHLLDHVQGTAHFAVDLAAAQAIYAEMQRQLPGYLLPRLVQEIAGAESKIPIMV